jgi:hypothetical protein
MQIKSVIEGRKPVRRAIVGRKRVMSKKRVGRLYRVLLRSTGLVRQPLGGTRSTKRPVEAKKIGRKGLAIEPPG